MFSAVLRSTRVMSCVTLSLLLWSAVSASAALSKPETVDEDVRFNAPLFEAFTVSTHMKQYQPFVNFGSRPEAKRYRDAITRSLRDARNNFAGHYNLASWGCGTNCIGFAITDLHTGKINRYAPIATLSSFGTPAPTGEESLPIPLGIAFRQDSNLLIVNPLYGDSPDELENRGSMVYGNSGLPRYFIWENDAFREVSLSHPQVAPTTGRGSSLN